MLNKKTIKSIALWFTIALTLISCAQNQSQIQSPSVPPVAPANTIEKRLHKDYVFVLNTVIKQEQALQKARQAIPKNESQIQSLLSQKTKFILQNSQPVLSYYKNKQAQFDQFKFKIRSETTQFITAKTHLKSIRDRFNLLIIQDLLQKPSNEIEINSLSQLVRIAPIDKPAVELIASLAAKNNISAMILMADVTYQGHFVQKSKDISYTYMKTAANKGSARAMTLIAAGIQVGFWSEEPNPIIALDWYERAAKLGSGKAALTLSQIYLQQQNEQRANYWFQKALDTNYPPAWINRATIELDKGPTLKNCNAALEFLQNPIKQNDPPALHLAATIYLNPQNPIFNQKQGMQILKKAAILDNSQALYTLGLANINGKFTPKNLKYGSSLINQAAQLNHPNALFYIYNAIKSNSQNHHFPYNKDQALNLLARAANAQHPIALYQLALIYQQGILYPKNLKTAFNLLNLAANQGYHPAMRKIGDFYTLGTGVPKNPKLAQKWYLIADQYKQKTQIATQP